MVNISLTNEMIHVSSGVARRPSRGDKIQVAVTIDFPKKKVIVSGLTARCLADHDGFLIVALDEGMSQNSLEKLLQEVARLKLRLPEN